MNSAILIDGPYLRFALRAVKAGIDYGQFAKYLAQRYAPLREALFYTENLTGGKQVLKEVVAAGYTVRLAPGLPNRAMKGLDVQLAVDMMRVSDSCDRVILLSGDADLTPSVFAVVNRGVAVELLAFPTILATELRKAATSVVDLMTLLTDVSVQKRPVTPSQEEAELWFVKGITPDRRKDVRAMWVGVLLERALRELCKTHDLPVSGDDGLDALNNRLAKAGVYEKLTQKKITVWAEIRNKAVHGHFERYTDQDVKEMESWVARFIESHGA